MMRPMAALLGLACAFIAGLMWLSGAHFERGSSYPEYSSLRTDPMGTRVLYESLMRLGRLRVSRNYRPLELLETRDATILVLGLKSPMGDEQAERMLALAGKGNRVVVAYREEEPKPKSEMPKQNPKFTPNRSEATTFAEGKGSLVVAPGAGYFLNGALAGDWDEERIAGMLGSNQTILFDESHLGVTESGSLVGLARRFRMEGFAMAAAAVFLLFVWRNGSPFPPLPRNAAAEVSGRTSAAGLATLIRHNLAESDLARTAWALWLKGSSRPVASARRERAESAIEAGGEPLHILGAIHAALQPERKS